VGLAPRPGFGVIKTERAGFQGREKEGKRKCETEDGEREHGQLRKQPHCPPSSVTDVMKRRPPSVLNPILLLCTVHRLLSLSPFLPLSSFLPSFFPSFF
jgi:hypothetical protein